MPRTRDSIIDIWGDRTPYHGEGQWPMREDEQTTAEPHRWVQSCCLLCSNGCGMDIGVKDGRIVGVRGREVDRVNHGRLGPKGLHGWVANNSVDRLTKPLIRNGSKPDGAFREASWDEAMALIVKKTREAIKKYTPLSVGFYNTGQFFIEDYYTLSIIAHAGIGTDQMDGNTRLCTATASVALRESFGSDGQPASYADVDVTDCILLCGHNVANTQTVLWMRMLDRKRGPNPPHLIVIDPRETATAKEANVHLAPKVGTNVAVMNGLLHLMIAAGHVEHGFIGKHTVGFEKLAETVAKYPPGRVREITGIPESKLQMAGELLGTTPTLLSTVLQGFYQSNQATAASVQVNNVNLIRGLIGRPGCGVLQMNGQPTAQNTRETGCDGEYPAFRNWHNRAHMEDLARRWNVDPLVIPHWHEPASAMEIFRHAETGSLKFLWIMATNPAVSLPELHRIRRILASQSLFVVVQDAFITETAELADVILPAAIWGEKTGTFTNADRTVHISHKAVDPPGEAKADIDILLDYAKRMDFRDKDGAPLVKWTDAEGAFEHWKECSRGWPCDYSAMTYDKLTGGSGIQWPCTAEHPDGTERLYTDHIFRTQADLCESYGHDLNTGAARDVEEYRANDPRGRAILKHADHQSPLEEPDDAYPFFMTTGRVVYHFHTRTKTGRSKELCEAAPDAFVQMNPDDARRLGIAEDELVEVRSRRGTIQAPARIGDIEPGHVFVPFHYGYWDNKDGKPRAANELTLTAWDPISKQPYYKFAAVQVHRLGEGSTGEQATDALGKLKDRASETADKVLGLAHKTRSHVPDYLGLLDDAHAEFVAACESIASHHFEETMIRADLNQLAGFSREAREMLVPFIDRYGRKKDREPTKLRKMLVKPRAGAFGLLRDLHRLYLMYSELHVCLMVLEETAEALRDRELLDACKTMREHSELQRRLVSTQIKHRAPHTLVVPQ